MINHVFIFSAPFVYNIKNLTGCDELYSFERLFLGHPSAWMNNEMSIPHWNAYNLSIYYSFLQLEVRGLLNFWRTVYITQEILEDAALFPRLKLPSTLIRHENGAFRKRSSYRRNLKTLVFRFLVDWEHSENRAFWNRRSYDFHLIFLKRKSKIASVEGASSLQTTEILVQIPDQCRFKFKMPKLWMLAHIKHRYPQRLALFDFRVNGKKEQWFHSAEENIFNMAYNCRGLKYLRPYTDSVERDRLSWFCELSFHLLAFSLPWRQNSSKDNKGCM